MFIITLYTRYPIVARALGLAALGRVRRASKGILHTNNNITFNQNTKIPEEQNGNSSYYMSQHYIGFRREKLKLVARKKLDCRYHQYHSMMNDTSSIVISYFEIRITYGGIHKGRPQTFPYF